LSSLSSSDPAKLSVFWAKIKLAKSAVTGFHPVICHMIDVAQVARALWNEVLSNAARAAMTRCLGTDDNSAQNWVALLAGLHDLGKAAPTFQLHPSLQGRPAVLKAIRESLQAAGFRCPMPTRPAPHGVITASELPHILTESFFVGPDPAARLATVIGGHHGILPNSSQVNACENSEAAAGGAEWRRARSQLVTVISDLFSVEHDRIRIDNPTAMTLAGLVSVADWIGSAEEFFPYESGEVALMPDLDPAEYAKRSATQARNPLTKLRWPGWTPDTGPRTFADLFPLIPKANALQETVIDIAARIREPALMIVEAPMGEGKTEAAMYLADRFTIELGQRGCYFALPTQATSNQMFSRVRSFLERRYDHTPVNLQLLHGHAALSAEFQTLRLRADLLPVCTFDDDNDPGAHSGAVAAEWFTYRKRGLLAPFGVGTIDQALLAVLQTRHVFVRLFGLAHKVVIIDEVHAYDAYMTTLLERLLEWLAALGSSVVLLSATLPRVRRKSLAAAFSKGLGATASLRGAETYPRVTWVNASSWSEEHIEVSQSKTVAVEWVNGQLPDGGGKFELGERLRAALANGGCAAVICNTIGRAQQVYGALKHYFIELADDGQQELDLFHARYLFKDRDLREKRALLRFGKPDSGVDLGGDEVRVVKRPIRAVLVATQVIEQSLDLDFDLMVTDHAPVDLILQRAGRLHRHDRPRPAGLHKPRLWICRCQADDDGVPNFGSGDVKVYDEHVLLRSWLELKDRVSIAIPNEVENLIEAVYEDRKSPAGGSAAIHSRGDETLKHHAEELEYERGEAQQRWLQHPAYSGQLWRLTADPRDEDEPDFHQAHQALTRLTEPSVSVVLLSNAEAADLRTKEAKAFLMRSVQISDKRILGHLMASPTPTQWNHSALLRHHRLLVLDDSNSKPLGQYVLKYDPELGVVISNE